ncbi:MAG TPA: flagellar hook-associated protein 3, partial [Treponemataceae bacterium]|nr:flagellar hook-associated protein 3 [Treponemataceae bacterium]
NISVEVDELLKELVSYGNATGPDGTRLFSGTKSFTEPFETVMGDLNGAGEAMIREVRYNGSVDGKKIEADELTYLETEQAGNRTFWAERQSLFSELDAKDYSVKADSVIEVDGVSINLTPGDTVHSIISKINDSGAAVKANLDPVTNGLNIETTDARQLWLRDAAGSTVLSDLGMIKPDQRPPYNLSASVRVSGGSLFDAVIALRDSLFKGDQEAIGSRVLGSIDGAVDNLSTRLAGIGSRYERAQATLSRIEVQKINVTAAESRESDLDFTKAVTDLKMFEYTHQAALGVAGKLYSNTLLNYVK